MYVLFFTIITFCFFTIKGSESGKPLELFYTYKIGNDRGDCAVPIQHCVVEVLVDYLSLEQLKTFSLLDKKTNDYVDNADFYRIMCAPYYQTKSEHLKNFFNKEYLKDWRFNKKLSWKLLFLSLMGQREDYCLKVIFCYLFGFDVNCFFSIKKEDFSIFNPKRRYYSDIPSLLHLQRIFSFDRLVSIINTSNDDKKRIAFVLALPKIFDNYDFSYRKEIFYEYINSFSPQYKNAAFVLWHEWYQENKNKSFQYELFYSYIVNFFTKQYLQTGKINAFSSCFWKKYFTSHFFKADPIHILSFLVKIFYSRII